MTSAAFAIPGDITLATGGYAYDRRVLALLPTFGVDVHHLALPGGFPDPSVRDLDDTCASSPDGVAWTIDRFDGVSNQTLVMGALADGGAQEFRLADGGGRLVALAVNEGDFLYFTVDPLAEIGCDSTALDIVIRPATSGVPFCFGDGVDASHTTPCPCANDGEPGHGCGNSMNPGGALLEGSGTIEQDDVTLLATGMPSTVACVVNTVPASGRRSFR